MSDQNAETNRVGRRSLKTIMSVKSFWDCGSNVLQTPASVVCWAESKTFSGLQCSCWTDSSCHQVHIMGKVQVYFNLVLETLQFFFPCPPCYCILFFQKFASNSSLSLCYSWLDVLLAPFKNKLAFYHYWKFELELAT